jgi:hypothetical protein
MDLYRSIFYREMRVESSIGDVSTAAAIFYLELAIVSQLDVNAH